MAQGVSVSRLLAHMSTQSTCDRKGYIVRLAFGCANHACWRDRPTLRFQLFLGRGQQQIAQAEDLVVKRHQGPAVPDVGGSVPRGASRAAALSRTGKNKTPTDGNDLQG